VKNSKIHEGLPDQAIRDFLARQRPERTNENYLTQLQKDIQTLQEELQRRQISNTTMDLVEKLKWGVFGVSADVDDYNHDTYFPFIGTEKEFEHLCIRFDSEDVTNLECPSEDEDDLVWGLEGEETEKIRPVKKRRR